MTDLTLVDEIRRRYLKIQEEIAESARKVGRDPAEIQLVVVTKKHSVETIRAAIDAGVTVVGENYPKEAVSKQQVLGDENTLEWHMIGHVQSRKARLVVEHFSMFHALDRLKIARRLDRFAAEFEKKFPVLLEFNVSGEESKAGWDASDKAMWESLLPVIEEALALPNLQVCGLMTMPPYNKNPELTRPYFQKLRLLREYLQQHFPDAEMYELSMGTSVDFRVAVEEGATMVRIGEAIVGARPV